MLRSQLLCKNGGITESQRRGWGLEQGGLRNLVENGMRVLGGRGANPSHPFPSLALWTLGQSQAVISRAFSLLWTEE